MPDFCVKADVWLTKCSLFSLAFAIWKDFTETFLTSCTLEALAGEWLLHRPVVVKAQLPCLYWNCFCPSLFLIFFYFAFIKEVNPVFQVQPTTPSHGSSFWFPVPTIHMRYMAFFWLYAKNRQLLFQPLHAEVLQYLDVVPSAHQSLCSVCQSLFTLAIVSLLDHSLLSHQYHDSCVYSSPLQTPWWSKDLPPISSPHPAHWGVPF